MQNSIIAIGYTGAFLCYRSSEFSVESALRHYRDEHHEKYTDDQIVSCVSSLQENDYAFSHTCGWVTVKVVPVHIGEPFLAYDICEY